MARSVTDIAAWMPLAHSVPDVRIRSGEHNPAAGLPVTSCGDAPFADGVCFYLGPLRRRYRGPRKFPVIGYLFTASVEQSDWVGFPCDVGGWLRRPHADPSSDPHVIARLTLREHAWRSFLLRLLTEGFSSDWTAYLAFDGPGPAPYALATELQSSRDPLSWTPEVRSPRPVPIDGNVVHVAFVMVPLVAEERDRDEALSAALNRTRNALTAQGVRTRSAARMGAETSDRAMHRVSEAWIRSAA